MVSYRPSSGSVSFKEWRMAAAETLTNALDAALAAARAEYRNAVIELADTEAAKAGTADREPADVDRIHHARTRVIALEAARNELSSMIEQGAALAAG